jgi:hypothetical protein
MERIGNDIYHTLQFILPTKEKPICHYLFEAPGLAHVQLNVEMSHGTQQNLTCEGLKFFQFAVDMTSHSFRYEPECS